MLLAPFRGADLKAYDRHGEDITAELFAPNGFLRVDADYTAKPYEEWTAEDWPKTYQSPRYHNLFGVGITFAPPHPISRPRTTPTGTVISPGPAPHRHAIRRDRPSGGRVHCRAHPTRRPNPAAHGVDGLHGGRVHRLSRRRDAHRQAQQR